MSTQADLTSILGALADEAPLSPAHRRVARQLVLPAAQAAGDPDADLDDLTLAAYLDGRLGGSERDAVQEVLSRAPHLLELVTELALLEEAAAEAGEDADDDGEPSGQVIPFPVREVGPDSPPANDSDAQGRSAAVIPLRRWAPLAVAAAILLGLFAFRSAVFVQPPEVGFAAVPASVRGAAALHHTVTGPADAEVRAWRRDHFGDVSALPTLEITDGSVDYIDIPDESGLYSYLLWVGPAEAAGPSMRAVEAALDGGPGPLSLAEGDALVVQGAASAE